MTISKLFQRDVEFVECDDSVRTAAKRMADRKSGTLVVVDRERKPVGLVTDRDLTIRVIADDRDPDSTTVGDVMTSHPRTVPEFTPIEEVLALMRSLAVRRLPVVRSDGVLAGIVSVDDVVRLLVRELDDVEGLLSKETPHSRVPVA